MVTVALIAPAWKLNLGQIHLFDDQPHIIHHNMQYTVMVETPLMITIFVI